MAKRKPRKRDIENYAHTDKERVNNPPVGLVTPETDKDAARKTYAHDPHIDPQLSWAGKAEHTAFEVPTVSLHVHERIDPRTVIEAVRKRNGASAQASLFEEPEENPPIRQAIDFYQHRHNWSNRLIAGDSLLVMNSLLEKEGLGGQVQMAYIDPPYGIRYGSNFQPFVGNRDVTDGKDEDLTQEPETIRAFRDTWELGIHSYLTYLRDRLLLARELLTDSGSCFVQIGKENVHRVGTVMDEIFGAENRVATISYATTGGSSANTLPEVADYLLWYSKDKQHVKYRQLYEKLTRREILEFFTSYAMVELPDGTCRKPTPLERFDPDKNLPKGSRLYERGKLDSQGESTTGRSGTYEWNGRAFRVVSGAQWRVSSDGLDRLAALNRLDASGQPDVVALEALRGRSAWSPHQQCVGRANVSGRQALRRSNCQQGDSALHSDDHRSWRLGVRSHLRFRHHALRRRAVGSPMDRVRHVACGRGHCAAAPDDVELRTTTSWRIRKRASVPAFATKRPRPSPRGRLHTTSPPTRLLSTISR